MAEQNPIGWNVKADQPYATETQAAADIANPDRKSYMALPTLIGQQAQHSIDNSNYAEQLGYQRQFAYQQALDKVKEYQAKNAIDIMRLGNDNPGAIGLGAMNPSTAGSFAGMDPQAASLFNDWSSRMNASKIADQLGKGAQGFLQGGIQMPAGYASGILPGNPDMQLSDNPIIAAAKIKEAGSNARHAAGGGSGGAEVTIHDPLADIKYKNQTPEQARQRLEDYRSGRPGAQPQTPHVGGAPDDLPLAKRDTPAASSASTQVAPPAITSHVAQGIETNQKTLPKGMYEDARGGRPVVTEGGRSYVVGKSGKKWPIS